MQENRCSWTLGKGTEGVSDDRDDRAAGVARSALVLAWQTHSHQGGSGKEEEGGV